MLLNLFPKLTRKVRRLVFFIASIVLFSNLALAKTEQTSTTLEIISLAPQNNSKFQIDNIIDRDHNQDGDDLKYFYLGGYFNHDNEL